MTSSTRDLSDDQCQWFADDIARLDLEFARFLNRHKGLVDTVDGGTEVGPDRVTRAVALVREARALINEADAIVESHRA